MVARYNTSESELNGFGVYYMATPLFSENRMQAIIDKKLFSSSTDINQVILEIETISTISPFQITQLIQIFNQYGFLILQCNNFNHSEAEFLLLSKIFGKSTKHNRANCDGVVAIKPLQEYPLYLGASNAPHPLHTDGPFEKIPPKVMALQCENPDPVGGLSQVVSCRAIYQHLRTSDPQGLQLLFNSNAFTIHRDQQSETRAIFEYRDGKISMAFRTNDGKAKISVIPEALKMFDLILSFINNPQNSLSFKLERGQILITDNLSVLHGRTGFSKDSPRSLKRLNFDGESEYTPMLVFGFEP
jgi:alpha-ketoglutarate-dependent taurine dioxygenase